MAGLPFQNLPAVQENIDIFGLLDQRFNENLSAFNQSYETELRQLDKPLTQQKRSLQRQYDIKADYLGRQYLTDEDYSNKLSKLNQQLELGAAKFEDKQGSERKELLTTYQQHKFKLQEEYRQQKIRIQQIQDLVNEGHLSSEVGTQQQLRILGINVPLTQLQPVTPMNQFKELESIEDRIEEELEKHWVAPTTGGIFGRATPLIYSPTGEALYEEKGKEATKEEQIKYENLINQLNAVRAAKLEVLGQYEPRKATFQRRARRLTDVARRETTSFKSEIEESKQAFLKKTGKPQLYVGPFGGGVRYAGANVTKAAAPTPEELRRKNTKEAYEQGVKLGYWK